MLTRLRRRSREGGRHYFVDQEVSGLIERLKKRTGRDDSEIITEALGLFQDTLDAIDVEKLIDSMRVD